MRHAGRRCPRRGCPRPLAAAHTGGLVAHGHSHLSALTGRYRLALLVAAAWPPSSSPRPRYSPSPVPTRRTSVGTKAPSAGPPTAKQRSREPVQPGHQFPPGGRGAVAEGGVADAAGILRPQEDRKPARWRLVCDRISAPWRRLAPPCACCLSASLCSPRWREPARQAPAAGTVGSLGDPIPAGALRARVPGFAQSVVRPMVRRLCFRMLRRTSGWWPSALTTGLGPTRRPLCQCLPANTRWRHFS